MPALSEYGPNPNSGVNVNADHGWGGYQWPNGVPAGLLDMARYDTRGGQKIRVTVRRELVPLFETLFEITDLMGYPIYARNPDGSGEVWGPWSYENRAIGGTTTASNHSRAKAIDVNAPMNPQSRTFQSNLPPRVVAAWERCGFGWGGRYGGGTKYDPMHFEYAYSPGDVARHYDLAQTMLRALKAGTELEPDHGTPAPPTPVPDTGGFLMALSDAEQAEVLAAARAKHPMLDLIQDVDTTAVYAVGPGVFRHIDTPDRGVWWDNFGAVDWGNRRPVKFYIAQRAREFALWTGGRSVRDGGAVDDLIEPAAAPASPKEYTVQARDTLSGIAKKVGVADWHTIANLNGITNPESINPGQVLKLPN